MTDLQNLTISKAHELMYAGELTSEQLVAAYIEQIKTKNTEINAYLEVFTDALDQAKTADKKFNELKSSGMSLEEIQKQVPLIGIPFAIKDNILIEGKRAGASSKILENYIAPYDATAIVKIKHAGAICLGRVNMDEFAMGGSTENSAYGVTKNPRDISRVSGGSSGGSAAAVAMNGALASLGSDTGGSIRQPASFCGVVGLKPTYGRVSRHGLMAMGSSLDVIGPITNSVEGAEIIFDVIKNNEEDVKNNVAVGASKNMADTHDSTSISKGDEERVKKGKGLKIGIVPELMNMGGINAEVLENINQSIEKFKALGYEIKEVSLPHIKYSLPVYYILMPAEVSSNMSRFDGVKYGSKVETEGGDLLADYLNTRGELLGKEVRRRIMLGTYVLSSGYYDAYYNKANIARNLIKADFEKAFKAESEGGFGVDAILTPTAPTPAFKIGAHSDDIIQMYLEDVFTITANLVGVPAISIPSGVSKESLPLSIQLTAPHYCENVLFEIGKKFEGLK